MKNTLKYIIATLAAAAFPLCGFAAFTEVSVKDKPVVQVPFKPFADEAQSLLPPNKKWKLVWNDEFNGAEIDKTKWMCRESFWGQDFPAFAHNFEGVEMTGKTVRLQGRRLLLAAFADRLAHLRHSQRFKGLLAVRQIPQAAFHAQIRLL